MKNLVHNFGAIILSILLTSCSIFGKSSVETLKYDVIEESGRIEVRVYKPYIAATTFVEGSDYKKVQNKAFKILAGYIFGDNIEKEEIAMTSPVLQEKTASSKKITMTAPVLQEKRRNGWAMTFSMPSKYSLKDLPKPNSDKISFKEVDSKKFVSIRFNGVSNIKKNKMNAEKLEAWIKNSGKYLAVSDPVFAGYNPPWTLPYFRRNEILIEIKDL